MNEYRAGLGYQDFVEGYDLYECTDEIAEVFGVNK